MSVASTIVARGPPRDVAALAASAHLRPPKPVKLPKPYSLNCLSHATRSIFRLKAAGGSVLDQSCYGSPGPNSFTGEDVLELQGHSGQ